MISARSSSGPRIRPHASIPLRRTLLATSLLVLAACGDKEADLGSSPKYHPLYATEAPPTELDALPIPADRLWKLVQGEGEIYQLGVDSGQAFWALLRDPSQEAMARRILNRCGISGCKNSLLELGEFPQVSLYNWWPSIVPLVVDASRVYPPAPSGYSFPLIACSRDDCSEGQRQELLNENEDTGGLEGVIATSGETLVIQTYDGPARCELSDCAGSFNELLSRFEDQGKYDGARVHSINDGHVYIVDAPIIARTRLDGTGPLEILAADQSNIGQLVVHGDDMYWTESVALGTVKTCPKTGCIGEPRRLMVDLNRPTSLVVTGDALYVMEPCAAGLYISPRRDRILRCELPDCTQPTLFVENVGAMSGLFEDDDHIYFAGSDSCGWDSVAPEPSIRYDWYVAAIPK